MNQRIANIALLLLLAAAPVAAQPTFTDGTAPGAATELLYAGNFADSRGQTFTAAGTSLLQASIWFFGDVPEPAPAEGFFSRLYLFRVGERDPQNLLGSVDPMYQSGYLDQTVRGRYDFTFGSPLSLTIGELYAMILFTNNGGEGFGSFPNEQEQLPCSVGIGGPCIEVTTSDAYAGGEYLPSRMDQLAPDPNRDMRFELLYAGSGPSVVPEPSLAALLLLGLGSLALVVRRGGPTRGTLR